MLLACTLTISAPREKDPKSAWMEVPIDLASQMSLFFNFLSDFCIAGIKNMENYEDREIKEAPKSALTIFGEPIVKTNCQRNALISGISGGIISGLIGFLFTSSPRRATHIGVGGYFIITVTYACYCAYDEYEMRKQTRLIKQSLVEAHIRSSEGSADTPIKLDEA